MRRYSLGRFVGVLAAAFACGAPPGSVTFGEVSRAAGSGGTPSAPSAGTAGLGGTGGAATAGSSAGGAVSSGGRGGAGGAPPIPAALAACPAYADGFVPFVYRPVCSTCHGELVGIPDWEPYASALAACDTIGELVGNRSMPPSEPLAEEARALVARWVELGCPETATDSARVCAAEDAPVATRIEVERARFRAGQQDLELRGTASPAGAALRIEFANRREAILVDDSEEFRFTFTNVAENPGTLRIISGSITTTRSVEDG
jgi:hypothetical protein